MSRGTHFPGGHYFLPHRTGLYAVCATLSAACAAMSSCGESGTCHVKGLGSRLVVGQQKRGFLALAQRRRRSKNIPLHIPKLPPHPISFPSQGATLRVNIIISYFIFYDVGHINLLLTCSIIFSQIHCINCIIPLLTFQLQCSSNKLDITVTHGFNEKLHAVNNIISVYEDDDRIRAVFEQPNSGLIKATMSNGIVVEVRHGWNCIYLNVRLVVPRKYEGLPRGLFGNLNGKSTDEFYSRGSVSNELHDVPGGFKSDAYLYTPLLSCEFYSQLLTYNYLPKSNRANRCF